MKLTDKQWEDLSDLTLNSVRGIEYWLEDKGWNSITTGTMRMMTDGILRDILDYLEVDDG